MKKQTIILGVIAALALLVIIGRVVTPEDNWLCRNGQWVKHGHPNQPMPTKTCR